MRRLEFTGSLIYSDTGLRNILSLAFIRFRSSTTTVCRSVAVQMRTEFRKERGKSISCSSCWTHL